MKKKNWLGLIAVLLSFSLLFASGCTQQSAENDSVPSEQQTDATVSEIETALNLANNAEQEWSYSTEADAWVLSVVPAVAYPEITDQQGVSVCVPGAYVAGIDTDRDGTADVTAEEAEEAVSGALVIDYTASVTSTNGQTYTAATAPVILNTGAAGYSSSTNTAAATTYAAEGYINVSCGNRGKQDSVTDSDGNSSYTGDAPCCLVDQKNAARFVRYNILLGNLPGSVDYFVSTGGSGGGAHAVMFAATSDHPDFYDYEIEAGAVGISRLEDGSYSTCVTIDGMEYEISDGAWGCIAYSAITSLYEADMAMAFEYYLNPSYEFNTPFQKQTAEYLAGAYMEYINAQNLSVLESDVGFDLNGDGDQDDVIPLSIEYDTEKYPDSNGYGGTYLDLYLAEFTENLQWYLDNLSYAEGWTWFDENGTALSNEAVASMTDTERAQAFLEGRYSKGSSGRSGGPGGMGGGMRPDGMERPDGMNGPFESMGDAAGDMANGGDTAEMASGDDAGRSFANSAVAENSGGDTMDVGTPDAGSTQAAGSATDSANYADYAEMLAAYQSDIAEVEAGDKYGNHIVQLYNPLHYIGAEAVKNPAWVRILMGAAEGDMSMFSSLNLQLAFLKAGVPAIIEWQWDGGHVPSEALGDSFALWVDRMYGAHVSEANAIEKAAPSVQTENGSAESASGTDLTAWVDASDLSHVTFSLSSAAAYRTAGASKAIPGFDVIDYGQEDYVFGSSTADARHWNRFLAAVFEENADTLEPLFNVAS